MNLKYSQFKEKLRTPHIDIQILIMDFIDPEVYPFHPYNGRRTNVLFEIDLGHDDWQIFYDNLFKR